MVVKAAVMMMTKVDYGATKADNGSVCRGSWYSSEVRTMSHRRQPIGGLQSPVAIIT